MRGGVEWKQGKGERVREKGERKRSGGKNTDFRQLSSPTFTTGHSTLILDEFPLSIVRYQRKRLVVVL